MESLGNYITSSQAQYIWVDNPIVLRFSIVPFEVTSLFIYLIQLYSLEVVIISLVILYQILCSYCAIILTVIKILDVFLVVTLSE